jgi:radical SAM protein with 4Fe4S-binding SPASM domain
VSNATLWSERRIRLMIENPNLESLAISIDGGTKETYERIRVNGNWDKLVRNLENFARMKREYKTDRPALMFNTVLMKSTAKELPQLLDLAARIDAVKVEAIRYLPVNKELNEGIEDWEEVMPMLIEAKRFAHDNGIELFLPVEDARLDTARNTEHEEHCNTAEVGRFSDYCEAPWSAVQIYPNGDIHPCGYYEKPFGNLREQDFLEIWNNDQYCDLRRSLVKLRLHHKCEICNPHGFDNIERKGRINKLALAK